MSTERKSNSASENSDEPRFVIASVKHTSREHAHISFWGPDSRGYILALAEGRVGLYTEAQVRKSRLNDGLDCIAVPVEAVMALRTPTPYFKLRSGITARFYDIEGPVVDNSRANWDALIAASLHRPTPDKPKPQVFRGVKRSFSLAVDAVLLQPAPGAESDTESEVPHG